MGMQRMRDELEDLAFRHLMPDAYAMIESRLEDLRQKNGKIIATIEKEPHRRTRRAGIHAKVEGRQKQPYSVWRKMERKSIAFEQLSDIFGFRVVVENVEDCYRVIGVVHTKWASFRADSRIIFRRRSKTIISRSTPPSSAWPAAGRTPSAHGPDARHCPQWHRRARPL